MTAGSPAGVGFVGLGQIGAPMAKRLLDRGTDLVVCDAAAAAVEPFAGAGAHVAATPAEVAARCSVVSVMVRDDAQVREVVTGADGLLAGAGPGTVIAVHSTVEADTPAELARQAADRDVDLIDAPVSGGFMGAHRGTLAVMVGGEADAVDRVREPFAAFATLVAHMGPVGAGTRAKLARNLIHFVAMTAVGEAQRLAEAGGVDLTLLGEVVRHSDAVTGGPGSVMVRDTAAPLPTDDGLYPIFTHTRELGEKDLTLALQLADQLDVDLPAARLARNQLGIALGLPPTTTGDER